MNKAFENNRLYLLLVVILITTLAGCNYPGLNSSASKETSPPPTNPPIKPTEVPTQIPPTLQSHILSPLMPLAKHRPYMTRSIRIMPAKGGLMGVTNIG